MFKLWTPTAFATLVSVKLVCCLLAACAVAGAQTAGAAPPKAEPDELILLDGERLIGHLDRADASGVIFKSDMAGSVTVLWKNVKELHSHSDFAVIPKGFNLKAKEEAVSIAQGTLTVADQKVQVQPAAQASAGTEQTIPVSQTARIVDEPAFRKATSSDQSFFRGWGGAATLAVTLVTATQDNETITSAVNLVRLYPTVDWMNPVSRTSLNFTSSFGKLTQPGTPEAKTSIYHADGERDRYFTPALYVFGRATFDHNFSQGLDLQQSFGGGVGWTLVPKPANQLDLKAEVDYESQQFTASAQNQTLVGSIFAESFDHVFKHGVVLHQLISYQPAWNNSRAYTGTGDVNLKVALFKRLSLSIDTLDTFLNDPSPGFKRNSFQFSTGIAYAIK